MYLIEKQALKLFYVKIKLNFIPLYTFPFETISNISQDARDDVHINIESH